VREEDIRYQRSEIRRREWRSVIGDQRSGNEEMILPGWEAAMRWEEKSETQR